MSRASLLAPLLAILGVLAWSPAPASAQAVVPAPGPTLLVLGDSLSAGYGLAVREGWVALLQTRLEERGYGYRVVNASVSGETSEGAMVRMPHLLATHRPRLVLIELGGNDGLRGLPVEDLEAHLTALVRAARGARASVLLLGLRMPPNYGPQYTGRFAAAYARVAAREHAAVLPFLLEPVAGDERWFQGDGLHPSAAAQPLLLEHVWRALEPLIATPRARSR